MKQEIICRVLTGPTASGKSALGMELAKKYGWAIFCMDSMQIYRGMNIGTAKPTLEDRRAVQHEMLDFLDPKEGYSVSEYRETAEKKVLQLWEKERKEVLFVGGTGLYLQAMMHPMGMGTVPADEKLRRKLNALAETEDGKKQLHSRLRKMDPATAERLPVNDVRRIIRAIEVTQETGIPFSKQPERKENSQFQWKVVSMEMPREVLYARINARVLKMIEAGLENEVRRLLDHGVRPEMQSMQGLGYKEMVHYVKEEWTLDQTIEEIQKGTRHYAKRQITFLKREGEVRYIDAQASNLMNLVTKVLL